MSFRRSAVFADRRNLLLFQQKQIPLPLNGIGMTDQTTLYHPANLRTPNCRKKEKQADFTRLLRLGSDEPKEGYFLASMEVTLMVFEASSRSPFTTTSWAAKASAFSWSLRMKTFLLAPS